MGRSASLGALARLALIMVLAGAASPAAAGSAVLAGAKRQTASECGKDEVLVGGTCLAATTIAPDESLPSDREKLDDAFRRAAQIPGPAIIALAPRIYRLSCRPHFTGDNHCFDLRIGKPLRISGVHGETTLSMSSPFMGALSFTGARDLTIDGISFDYDRPPYAQGTVAAVDAHSATVRIDAGSYDLRDPALFAACAGDNSTCRSPLGEVFAPSGESKARWIYDYISTRAEPDAIVNLGPRLWKIETYNLLTGPKGFVAEGDRVAFTPLTAHLIEVYGSTNVSFFQLDVKAAPGAALLLNDVSGHIDIDSTKVMRTDPSRVLSTNYDGWHIINSRAPVELRNNFISQNGDDFINISTIGWPVAAVSGSKLVVEPPPGQLHGDIEVGDAVQFTDPSMSRVLLNGHDATVTSLTRVSGGDKLELNLDADLAGLAPRDVLFDLATSSPGSSVHDNTFGTHRGAIRLRSPGGSFVSNHFQDSWSATFLYSIDNAWPEGPILPPPRIQGNTVVNGRLHVYGDDWRAEGAL